MHVSLTLDVKSLANKFVWWETPTWAIKHPYVLFANVMNLGSWEDWLMMRKILKDHELIEVLQHAPPGYFSQRSWDYWNLKLGFKKVPPLPKREL